MDWARPPVIERGRSVWPDDDRLMQVTTLVLETTAEMDESFGSYAQYGDDVVTDWVWGLLSGALDTWDSRKATWTGRLPADDIVEMHGVPQAEVQTRVADLRALHEAIAKRTEPRQRTQGFVADATAGAERIHYVGWGYAVKKGEAFEGRDAIYLLVDVHRSFTYHPPLAEFTDLGLKWPRSVPGDDLVLDHGGQAIPRDLDLVTILRLDKGGKGSETKTIKGSDRGELYRVYRAVDWFTFFRHMENAGAVVPRSRRSPSRSRSSSREWVRASCWPASSPASSTRSPNPSSGGCSISSARMAWAPSATSSRSS